MWKLHIYEEHGRGRKTHWYWRLKTKNGRIVADGSESYSRRAGIMRAVKPLADALGAEVWEQWADWSKPRKVNDNVVPLTTLYPPANIGARALE